MSLLKLSEFSCSSFNLTFKFVCVCVCSIKQHVFFFTDKYPSLAELYHNLDIWHKACKLTKALSEVTTIVYILNYVL